MPSRRKVLAGLAATATVAGTSWADAGAPTHISAAKRPDGSFALYGLRGDGTLAFEIPLPARGHAAAAHPHAAEAVAFARRPGTFALVLDCVSGQVLHRLETPPGNHFYGHGAFSEDGTRLYTTENRVETGEGVIGVWSRPEGFRRIGAFASGGIGPHEMVRIPGTQHLAVANGGIRTHPATGREKLNVATMRPNLTILSEAGAVLDVAEVPPDLHQNSLRHIAARADGVVACGCQWQGDSFEAPPLLALFAGNGALEFVETDTMIGREMAGYVGSVAFSAAADKVALTSPRGGIAAVIDIVSRQVASTRQSDICGVAPGSGGLIATDGQGGVHRLSDPSTRLAVHALAFDNHLVQVATS